MDVENKNVVLSGKMKLIHIIRKKKSKFPGSQNNEKNIRPDSKKTYRSQDRQIQKASNKEGNCANTWLNREENV